MQHLTTTDLDHVSGGSAPPSAPIGASLRVPPGVDNTLHSPSPPFHGGPIHLPHVD